MFPGSGKGIMPQPLPMRAALTLARARHILLSASSGDHMEKLLLRLAQQLNSIDEASLMSLWSKYATLTGRFEPTRAWEEAALIFSLIQAKRWKNQLFNYNWARQSSPFNKGESPPPAESASAFTLEPQGEASANDSATGKRQCRVLPFCDRKNADASPAPESEGGKPGTDK